MVDKTLKQIINLNISESSIQEISRAKEQVGKFCDYEDYFLQYSLNLLLLEQFLLQLYSELSKHTAWLMLPPFIEKQH